MKKVMIGEENGIKGIVQLSSAAQAVQQGIYGFLLTAEEAEKTCFAGFGECICSTCTPDHCKWYEER